MKKSQKRFTLRNSKGFTLIELLAVIAIIGILAALILVSLSKARMQARDTQRKSIVRAMAQAEESYANNNAALYAKTDDKLKGYLSGSVMPSDTPNTCLIGTTVGTWSINNGANACAKVTDTTYTIKTSLESDSTKSFECTTGGNCK